MGKKTVSGFKKRMLVLQCLLRHGEKSINELVDLQLFEMEKPSLNQLVVNLFKDGYLTFRTAQAGERFYAVSEAFESELIDDLGMCAEQPIDPGSTLRLTYTDVRRQEMKRNHRVLILGNAVAGRVIDFNFYAENPIPSEWKEIDWGSGATQSLDVAEAKLSERLGLHQNPYYLDSIKDRHTNDDWRGKGNRRKLFK